ncbi:MAG: uroporphyrinogen-III C-methyltransferase [Tannerella sp.]|jgi:uroporphyrinogen III methyltransferase/synthase|nr:uroporphyrinogen-III C-methyltransferase [Tannerella sp.]
MRNTGDRKLKVTARNSPLSLIQVKEVFSALPAVEYDLTGIASFGDKNRDISLMSDSVAGDFFTRELDAALLNGEADVAVHSAKDLPYPLPPGLELYCLTGAEDKTDSLVSRDNQGLRQLPAGARIGTSSVKRKAELLKLRPDLTVVSIRGAIEERIAQVDNGRVDALIVATCALKRLGLTARIAETLPFKTHPLQGNLAVVGRVENPELKAVFSVLDVRRTYGKVTLAGFGPGNPELLTVGADNALRKADVIFHDDLIDKNFTEKYDAEKIRVGKRKGRHSHHQDEINEMIYRATVSGRNTVRLKGGDPMIFAHGREEFDFLKSRFVDVAIIPGISSGTALAACTHIPLTHRGVASSVAFVTGHSAENLQTPDADTLVYYMAGANISAVAEKLIAAGRDVATPVALVCNVSLPGQQTFFSTLKELRFSVFKYPTPVLVVVGEVVSFENGNGACKQNVLVTGTTCEEYDDGRHNITHTPLIRIQKARNDVLHRLLREKTGAYHWIIFTSRYGVRFFFEILDETGLDIRALGAIKIASVGKTTTLELKKHHIRPDVESAVESAEGLVNYFKETGLTDNNILLPRSDKGLKYLSGELEALGNRVTDAPVYENTVNDEAGRQDLSGFRKIFFSSPSGVDAFTRLYGGLPEGIPLVARGKTTENELKLHINETV